MKWAYLPVLFALSFLYTKMSLTDFLPSNQVKAKNNRSPAAVSEKTSPRSFRLKISPLEFFKEFDRTYYRDFQTVIPFRGTIIANASVENFGFVIGDSKKVTYQVLDFSEVSVGKYAYDVMAHFVSAKSLDGKMAWLEYFEAYKNGLRGYAHTDSFYIEKGIASALVDSDNFLEVNITQNLPITFTNLNRDNTHLSVDKRIIIEIGLKKLFPKIQFFEILTSDNPRKEFHILARIKPADKVRWIVLKEDTVSLHDRYYGTSLTSEKRLEIIHTDIYRKDMDSSIVLLMLDGKYFTMTFMERFSSRLSLDEVPFDDYHDIILDQARVLGSIHARSLGNSVDDYIKAWAKIPAALIDEKGISLKFKFIDQLQK